MQDQPGANGGRLSDAVHLDVEDVTGGSVVPVFAGQLGSFQNRALGSIAPGEARTYRFTASLPDGGAPPSPTSGDNAYAGSALTVRYLWTATAPDPGDGGTGTAARRQRDRRTGGTDGGTGGSGGGVVAPTVSFSVVSKQLVKKGLLDVMASCDRACTVSAWAQMPKASGARKGLKTSRKTATLTDPRQDRAHPAEAEQEEQAPAPGGAPQEEEGRPDRDPQRRRRKRRHAEELHQEGRRQAAEARASRSPWRSPASARAR